ncbi:MAG TPA: hypothetical protein VM597_11750, partial [Gemmataceae bacterium]|nr:hypothetical protein [Gemmataceae bacterium]
PGPFANEQGRKMFKLGQWAPVYMDLECVRDTEEGLVVWVETKDADGAVSEAKIETASMVKGERRTAVEIGRAAYLKPGDAFSDVSVRVRGAESGRLIGPEVQMSATMTRGGGIDGPSFMLLGVGASLSTVRFSTDVREEDGRRNPNANRNLSNNALRNGWVETAQLLELGLLPDQWFGYGAADVIYLGTAADRQFWVDFAAPQHEKRRKALAEWVRRGGRMIVSVGANPDVLNEVKEIRDLLPATVSPTGKRNVPKLTYSWDLTGNIVSPRGAIEAGGKAEFAVVTPAPRADRSARVLLYEGEGEGRKPLGVQGAYGLGRVTLIGFDLDRPPFAEANQRAPFYENLFSAAGYRLPDATANYERATGYSSTGPKMDEHVLMLQGSLDYFEGVPVVSFGWVALFILIYIILIGPVDYLFLKKVVKRLEWTWVTFPVIVVSVSAAAYFAAYALKGRDLKINKVDVVDIDLAGRRVDGQTWFTLFSPRIHDYSLGVEPAGAAADGGPAWSAGTVASAKDTVISWHGAVERYGSRSSGSGFFDKRYSYQTAGDPDDPNRDLYAAGIERVPIQVWTTKAFTAKWTAPIHPEKPPVVADLGLAKGSDTYLTGSITSHLPLTENPTDIALMWRGKVFKLDDLPTGVEKRIGNSSDAGEPLPAWLTNQAKYSTAQSRPSSYGPGMIRPETAGTTTQPVYRLWADLFYEAAEAQAVNQGYGLNASVRSLDQSWRVAGADRPEHAILVIRLATKERSAEDATADPANPSKLWVDALPTVANPPARPAVPGTLKQETYVRVFIPVKPGRK